MKHRSFIAIDIPTQTSRSIVSLQTSLDKLNLPVEWVPSSKLHLTLNFLGQLDHQQVHEIKAHLRRAVAGFTPFSLTPMFLETLYSRHEPSIIYLGLSGDMDQLRALRAITSDVSENLRLPQSRRFLPHVTIGKFKRTDPVATKTFLDLVEEQEFTPLLPFPVEYINLYESFVTRDGSTYQSMGKFQF